MVAELGNPLEVLPVAVEPPSWVGEVAPRIPAVVLGNLVEGEVPEDHFQTDHQVAPSAVSSLAGAVAWAAVPKTGDD